VADATGQRNETYSTRTGDGPSSRARVEAVFLQCYDSLKAVIGRYLKRPEDIEDIVQETFVRTWEARQKSGIANLKAYFFACQAVIAGMRAAGGGSIINVSSISYMMGNAGYPAYTTANGAITAMTRSLAREFGPDEIRVNALMPGWVLTEKQMEKWVRPEDLAAHMDRMCLKRHLVPDDIVGGMLFLASRASRAMTGQALVVDGGVVVTG